MRCFASFGVKIAILAACLLAGCGNPRLKATQLAIAPDIHGRTHQPLVVSGRANVVIFITTDCPISNAYAPEINSLVEEYLSRGVKFYVAHVDRDVTIEDVRQHAAEYGFKCPVLLDSQHELVKALGATVTPEAAVIDGERRLAYQGRIDDRYTDFGKKRLAPSQRDLREALDAVLAGRKVANPRTRAIGCYISNDSETHGAGNR